MIRLSNITDVKKHLDAMKASTTDEERDTATTEYLDWIQEQNPGVPKEAIVGKGLWLLKVVHEFYYGEIDLGVPNYYDPERTAAKILEQLHSNDDLTDEQVDTLLTKLVGCYDQLVENQ